MILERATLGGGCFWCLEAEFQEIIGVDHVVSGYAGGILPGPNYVAVMGETTGHAEVVQIYFNPEVITYTEVLDIFWVIHNPTTRNRQGNDSGTQYRSIILYEGDEQKIIAQVSRNMVSELWADPIVTEIKPLEIFYEAQAYHQNYFRNNPERAYCQVVINPKLTHLRQVYAGRLKQT